MNDNLTIIRAAENTEDMQFCEVCGGEWTDELPCLCELEVYGSLEDFDDYEWDLECEPDDSPLY